MVKIIAHALEMYCLRHYNDEGYYLKHPEVANELREKVEAAQPSEFNPKDFFHGHPSGLNVSGIRLLQDDYFIFALRGTDLVTVINIPGQDLVSDFFHGREPRKRRAQRGRG